MDERKRSLTQGVALIALITAGLNLRPGIVAVSPVLESIRADLALSYGVISFLTVIPTICFGLVAFAAPTVARRVGRVRGMIGALLLIFGGNAFRLFGEDAGILLGTTIILGVGVAISQAFLPALVNQYFPDRAASVTGLYSTTLFLGAAIAASSTVPLQMWAGSWEFSLAIWAIPVLPALLVWMGLIKLESKSESTETIDTIESLPWNDHWAQLSLAFFVGLVTLFYSIVTWLAPWYIEVDLAARTAGFLLAVVFVGMVIGSPTISRLADQGSDRRLWFGLSLAATFIGIMAITVLPRTAPFVWTFLLGFGLGGLFPLALTLPVDYAAGTDAVGAFTALMLGVGYLIGGLFPFLIGSIRDVTGSYAPSFAGLGVVCLIMAVIVVFFRPVD